jgi:glycosyltransferase involved in cell wall biosynthesis
LKIGIDVLSQSPGFSTGALSQYLQMARFLPERDPSSEYIFFSGWEDVAYYQAKTDRIRVVGGGWGNRHHKLRILSEHFLLWRAQAREKLDLIFHSGSGVAPVVMPRAPKLVLGIWGMQHVSDAQIAAGPKLYRRLLFQRSLERADVCLVNSEYSRDLLLQHYTGFSAPVAVIRHGVDFGLFHPSPPDEEDRLRMAQLGVAGPYLLFVGQIYLYKLLHILAEAFCDVMDRSGLPHQLVVIGSFAKAHGMGEEYRARIIELMRSRGYQDRLVLAQDIGIGALRAFYAGADVYVQPSDAETFGRTVLEAMACGCPVIAARAGATPEVLGDAGLYYEAQDVSGCAAHLENVLQDGGLRKDLTQRGLARVQKFSFAEEIAQMVQLFHDTVEGRVSPPGGRES